MIELYQFEFSQYSEKVRLILDYKGLEYRKIEVTPGVGQIELFQKYGYRQVPILKDGETVVKDSTEIAFYLERQYPDRPLIPTEPIQKGQCLLMEEWADESIGIKGRIAFLGALNKYPNLRTSVLPDNVPGILKNIIGAVPSELLNILGTGVGCSTDAVNEATKGLKQDLEALSLILQERPYLIGDQPTLADLTVAGLSILLKFPSDSYLDIPEDLKGKGIPGLADNSDYEPFFKWRDRLYRDLRKSGNKPTNSSPTSIAIE